MKKIIIAAVAVVVLVVAAMFTLRQLVGVKSHATLRTAAIDKDPQIRALALRALADATMERFGRIDVLINNAGVAHYMPFIELPAEKANELIHVKVVAPTMLARAAARGMAARGDGTIINVSGMLAFSGPAPIEKLPLRRAVYTGALAHIVALSQAKR